MTNEKKWYVVYTKPKWEKKVAALLSKKEIDNYCPVRQVKKQWADRKKTIVEPLFTSYVFIKISKEEYVRTLETEGVVCFITLSGKPAAIREEEIEMIRQFLLDYTNVTVEKGHFSLHDKVRITEGALQMIEGEIKEIRRKTVCVLLPSIGFQLMAELDKDHLEKIAG